jgi:hypothetical protein
MLKRIALGDNLFFRQGIYRAKGTVSRAVANHKSARTGYFTNGYPGTSNQFFVLLCCLSRRIVRLIHINNLHCFLSVSDTTHLILVNLIELSRQARNLQAGIVLYKS